MRALHPKEGSSVAAAASGRHRNHSGDSTDARRVAARVQTVSSNDLHDLHACIRPCGGSHRWTSSRASRPRAGSCPSRAPRRSFRHAVGALAPGASARSRARRAALRARTSFALADAGRSRVSSRRDLGARSARHRGRSGARRPSRAGLTVSTTVSFASLWVIPRLASFRERHPEVEVYVSADDR